MEKYHPIKLPREKKYGNNYYISFSKKLHRNVILYSQLEYHNFLTLEMNPRVVEFCEQPLEINVQINDHIETSIFDMWVLYDNGIEEFQEVKYQNDIVIHNSREDRIFKQILKQNQWCNLNGYQYTIRTDKEIYIGSHYISNLRYMHGVIVRNNAYLYEDYITQVILHIKKSKVTILYLTQSINLPVHILVNTIIFGIYTGALSAEINESIFCYDTSIWVT